MTLPGVPAAVSIVIPVFEAHALTEIVASGVLNAFNTSNPILCAGWGVWIFVYKAGRRALADVLVASITGPSLVALTVA